MYLYFEMKRALFILLLMCVVFVFMYHSTMAVEKSSTTNYTKKYCLVGTAEIKGTLYAYVENSDTGQGKCVKTGDAFETFTIKRIRGDSIRLTNKDVEFVLCYERTIPITTEEPLKKKRAPLKIKFISPMKGKFTSGFGYRQHPMGGAKHFHSGVDIAASYGTSVKASADGKVEFAGWKGELGRCVILSHEKSYRTIYGHLSRTKVKKGQEVKQGQIIGLEGSTGRSTGPHLHFEIRKGKTPLDPEQFINFR